MPTSAGSRSSYSSRFCRPSFFERRPSLFLPALDGLLVALVGPALWLLQAVPQRFEQTAHVSRMVA